MLRDRPLTCLFLAATVVVDLVVLTMIKIPHQEVGWLAGFVLGQAALVAHWAAAGKMFRLSRGAWLIGIVGLLVYLGCSKTTDSASTWLAFLAGYVLLLLTVALLINLVRFYQNNSLDSDNEKKHLRISVIELFGWTILVAIVSYSVRYMDFGFLRANGGIVGRLVAMVLVPAAFTLGIKKDLRDLNQFAAFLIVVAFIASGFVLAQSSEDFIWLIAVQTAYLLAWFFVSGLDRVTRDAKVARKAKD